MMPKWAFNPSLVRLAPPPTAWPNSRSHTFNPSLVRLALIATTPVDTLAQLFQSQLGSIGAADEALKSLEDEALSIPAWFDWREFVQDYIVD